jgi:hypothetical protein
MDFGLDTRPEVAPALAKLAAIEAELREANKAVDAATAATMRPDVPIRELAALYLAGQTPEEIDAAAAEKELQTAQRRQDILRAAVGLQREAVAAAKGAASREICRELGPAFLARAKKIRDTAATLLKLATEQRDFFQDADRQGVALREPITTAAAVGENLTWQLERVIAESAEVLKNG